VALFLFASHSFLANYLRFMVGKVMLTSSQSSNLLSQRSTSLAQPIKTGFITSPLPKVALFLFASHSFLANYLRFMVGKVD
jgi:hypothetical protein